jgi:dihydrofolate reductase
MIHMIFAVDAHGGIGNQGTLPWPHISEDMAHFKKLTDGNVVVMGRKTWDDPKMPKPLPGRITYVATSRPLAQSMTVSGDLREQILAIEARHPAQDVYIIGGADVIAQTIDLADTLHVTHVRGVHRADTRLDLRSLLKSFAIKKASCDPKTKCTFVTYENFFKRTPTNT